MWISLGNTHRVDRVVRVVPDASKGSLLFKDVNGFKAILGNEVPGGHPISDGIVFE